MKTLYVDAKVKQGLATISSDLFDISITIEGESFPTPTTLNFALWISLPIAMSCGRKLHLNGKISERALQNARKLVEIWSTWIPSLFKKIEITANKSCNIISKLPREPDLMLYSGGLDSTFSLLKNYINLNKPVSLLTVHGMDYDVSDTERFSQLLKKTSPLTKKANGKHFISRSNAAEIMDKFGIDGGIGHGFHLFGNLFLFEDCFEHGVIASDCSEYIDFLISPWGTNHITNDLFKSERFNIKTLDSNIDRAEKTGELTKLKHADIALTSASFCKDRSSRPNNCGVCSKCVRTKAMFYTETGGIPNIFLNSSFESTDVRKIDLSDRGERALMLDLLNSAYRNGKAAEFVWLDDELRRHQRRNKKNIIRRLFKI